MNSLRLVSRTAAIFLSSGRVLMQSIGKRLLNIVDVLAGKRVQYPLDIVVRKYCDGHLEVVDSR